MRVFFVFFRGFHYIIYKMMKECVEQAERFLLLRDHNKRELTLKLKNKNFSDSDIEKAIQYLEDNNELSEARYVQSFVRSNNRRHPEGKFIILHRLAEKGADRIIAKQVVDEIYSEEYVDSLIENACLKLSEKGREADFKALSKLGFSLSEINRNKNGK